MMNESTYETLDWELEAQRVARAFGCDADCHFEERLDGEPTQAGLGSEKCLCWKIAEQGQEWVLGLKGLDEYWNHSYWFPDLEELAFSCTYNRDFGRHFILHPPLDSEITSIEIGWEGEHGCGVGSAELALRLAKGLFHLGLLTDEIEAEMNLGITAHEKLEWTREYQE